MPARIVARRVHAAEKTIPADLRERLAIGAGEPLRYRRVQLVCGTRVLSEADNWYVPSRLTPAMNRLLETTDEPFGKVVRALDFRRHTLSAQLLWSPLPQDGLQLGNAAGGASFEPPYEILQHRAILETPERVPFSALIETYTRETIAGLR